MSVPAPTKIHTEDAAVPAHDTGFPEPFAAYVISCNGFFGNRMVDTKACVYRERNTTLPFMPPGSSQEIDNAAELTGDGEKRKRKLLARHHGRRKSGGSYEGMSEEINMDDDDEEEGSHGVKKVLKKLVCVKG